LIFVGSLIFIISLLFALAKFDQLDTAKNIMEMTILLNIASI